MASPPSQELEQLNHSEHDTTDVRERLIAAVSARAGSTGDNARDEFRKQAEEHTIRQTFRRLLNPGIIRPNSDKAASSAIKTLLTISGNLLSDPDNPKYAQFKTENNVIKRNLVEVRGALEYAVALGFYVQVQEFQHVYVFNPRKMRELQIGNKVLKEHVDLEDAKSDRKVHSLTELKVLRDAAHQNVLLAYQEDRRAKAQLDEREKAARQARETASAEAHTHPNTNSQPSPDLSLTHSAQPELQDSSDHLPIPGSDA